MIDTVEALLARGIHDIIIVNDGSDAAHLALFETLAGNNNCTLLSHDVNLGKGRALKTGMQYFLEHRPNSPGVVTIDGDGQHHPDDILACAQAMLDRKDDVILGVRDFSGPSVPFKSRFGNNLTKSIFRFFCGIKLSDTQTGLRAIPRHHIPTLLAVAGDRFEYETNVLLEMKTKGIPFSEIKIQTIYLDENAATHFHPVRDSIKIYGVILNFGTSSLVSSLIELALFAIIVAIFDWIRVDIRTGVSILIATAVSRVVSALCNYMMNRSFVFGSGSRSSLLRYTMLCVVQLLVSAAMVSILTWLFSAETIGQTVLKAIVDTILFFLSYKIQKEWVFHTNKHESR